LGKERLRWSQRQVEMHTTAGSKGIYEERKQKVKWLTVEERKGRDAGKADGYYESDPNRIEEPCGYRPRLMTLCSEGGNDAQSEM